MTKHRLVLTTAPSKEEAHKIARGLVDRRLAACVNIVPQIESVYRWQGKIEEAQEYVLVIKTTSGAFEKVRDAIRELHSYELPECICLAIDGGSSAYLKWLEDSVESG
ncbi:MAG: divalent-cation tolerance protein CutA [Acidobacteriia bacterium]|nr:divalent-cation tolerance protein CutA [Terriglobia bacterium]